MTGNKRRVIILQDRDIHLFRELAVMRVVDREQAKVVAGFGSTTRANARLLALTDARYLHRFFWGTVGGARKGLYSLSPKSAVVAGVPYRRPRRPNGDIIGLDTFTAHQLAVNEFYCAVKYGRSPAGTASFIRWLSFHESLTGTALIPDGYAEIDASGKTFSLFLEIDLGTETLTVWRKKVVEYLTYASSGLFASQFHQPTFRVMVVASTEGRMSSLRRATAVLTDKIFRFTTAARIEHESFWAPIWQKPTGDERQALI
jgi:hypothetical protein